MQLIEFFIEYFTDIFIPVFTLCFLPVFFNLFFNGISSKLILNCLHLLMEKELALLLVKIALNFRLQFILKLKDLYFLYQKLKKHETPVAQTVHLQ